MRRALPIALVSLGIVAALIGFWMSRLFRSADFVELGVEALRAPSSQEVIVDAVVDAIAGESEEARVILAPVASRALGALLSSPLVEDVLVAVAQDLYDALLSDEPSDVVLVARALVEPVADGVAIFDEQLAAEIRGVAATITLIDGDTIPSFRTAVSTMRWQRWIGLALAAFVILAAWSRDRRPVEVAGAGVAVGGILGVLAVPVARGPVLGLFTDERAEVLATEAYALGVRGLVLAGIVVAMIGASILVIGLALDRARNPQ